MYTDELQYFISNQNELVGKYPGKVLVIMGNQVIGVYSSALEAYTSAKEKFEIGSFMIQPCEPGPNAYTVTIASSGIVHY